MKVYSYQDLPNSERLSPQRRSAMFADAKGTLQFTSTQRSVRFADRFKNVNSTSFNILGFFGFVLLLFTVGLYFGGGTADTVASAQSIEQNYYNEIVAAGVVTDSSSQIKQLQKYKAKGGETVYSVCDKVGMNCAELMKLNNLRANTSLKPNQVILYL